jgi:hypothetical protein
MPSIRRILSIASVGIMATGAMTAAISMPATSGNTAHATIADCKTEYGFESIPYNQLGTPVYRVDLGGGRYVELQFVRAGGYQYGFAKISGATQKGDLVWLDWSDARPGWMQCGPFKVQKNGSPNTSRAKYRDDVPEHWIRACGQALGQASKCGSWWH